jgi:hypothetical protein
MQQSPESKGLCMRCSKNAFVQFADAHNTFWMQLPKSFGLQDWDGMDNGDVQWAYIIVATLPVCRPKSLSKIEYLLVREKEKIKRHESGKQPLVLSAQHH